MAEYSGADNALNADPRRRTTLQILRVRQLLCALAREQAGMEISGLHSLHAVTFTLEIIKDGKITAESG